VDDKRIGTGRPAAAAADRRLLEALSLAEKINLLTGADKFTLPGHAGIGLRGLVMSDGPAGVRGAALDPADRSSSLPAPIALAATWDPELVALVAEQLGIEARAKGIDVLLGPTVNLVRTPYGGRGFECFGEDPLLAARIAAAYVRGVQSAGVAATAKHFVGNDSETERWTVDVRVDQTTLREVYLAPFEACITEAECALVMAGYNTVNGETMTEHGDLLQQVLKDDWGFTGAVVSDWMAARTTEATALAGLDLVMPGPQGPWGEALVRAVAEGAIDESVVDGKVLRLLRIARRFGALDPVDLIDPIDANSVNGLNGSGPPRAATRTKGPQADRAVLRTAAARSFTLLRNTKATLPLDPAGTIALIGPNAFEPQYQGLGSAMVGIAAPVGPIEGLHAALAAATPRLTTALGCATWLITPAPRPGVFTDPATGGPGARLVILAADGRELYADLRDPADLTWWDPLPEIVTAGMSRMTLSARYLAEEAGTHRFAVGGLGRIRLELDGVTVADALVPQPSDPVLASSTPFEVSHELELTAGQSVLVNGYCEPDDYEGGFVRFRIGAAPVPDRRRLLAEAVAAARAADTAIVVVGSAHGTESEGYDRETLSLPGRQDELIEAVAEANPRTVVVVNSGMPVLMPWADRVAAVLQVWFPGQEFGHALADVLLGLAEPTGRLPVTFPRSEAQCPVGPAKPLAGALEYTEGVRLGYRGYDEAGSEPLFPFGHGLGYTTWAYEELSVPTGPVHAGADVELTVSVRNTGRRAGRETVQVYLVRPDRAETAGGPPVRVLAGFAGAEAEPGGAVRLRLRLPGRAFARWDEAAGGWSHPHGRYSVEVGRSARDLPLKAHIEIG
jgi:beta-glucosidase